MKRKNIFAIILLILFFVSCKKKGCTDIDAKNHNENAVKDDNSCHYESSLILWWNDSTSQNLSQNYFNQQLKIYFNKELKYTIAVSQYWIQEPECDQTNILKFNLDLKQVKTQATNYDVKTENEDEIWSGVVSLNANKCTLIELNL